MLALTYPHATRKMCEKGLWIVHENGVFDASTMRRLNEDDVAMAIEMSEWILVSPPKMGKWVFV